MKSLESTMIIGKLFRKIISDNKFWISNWLPERSDITNGCKEIYCEFYIIKNITFIDVSIVNTYLDIKCILFRFVSLFLISLIMPSVEFQEGIFLSSIITIGFFLWGLVVEKNAVYEDENMRLFKFISQELQLEMIDELDKKLIKSFKTNIMDTIQ